MRRVPSLSPAIGLLLLSAVMCNAQPWTGIIAPERATDWRNAGVSGGIPNRTTQCGSTINAYSGTAATINSAIANCPAGQVVQLGAGTFNLSTGVELNKSNITLRGAGADATILNISGDPSVSCHIGDSRTFNMCTNGGNIGVDSASNSATWTGGYSQGTTAITLSAHNNLTVGSTIWLDQLDETSDGYPSRGDIWTYNWGGGESLVRTNRGTVEGHIVTACGTSAQGAACTSNSVTITPPIAMPAFRASQSPGAWWGNPSDILVNTGVENLTIDSTPDHSNGIFMINATNCWIKGVRVMRTDVVSSGQPRQVNFINAVGVTVQDNYFYGVLANSLVSNYGITAGPMSFSLVQNNIIHASTNPFVINTSSYGNVFAYNYFNNVGVDPNLSQSSFILHGAASMNLFEGNVARNFSGDNIHIGHFFTTLFRNHLDGTVENPSVTETQAGVALYAVQRFFNVVGNVMAGSNWSSYQNSSASSHCSNCIYELGWQGTNSTAMSVTGNDTNVARTLFRWGNWDNVNNAARFVASEVPSGIANYPNAVPASQTLPASLYLPGLPSGWWRTPWGTPAWPPIGPDVSGGDATNSPAGGHAYKTPARLCFENSANDPSYSSSPRVKLFSASKCYVASPAAPLAAPTGLATTVF